MQLYKGKYWEVVFVDWCQEFVGDCIISSTKESLSDLASEEWVELGKIEKELERVAKKVFNATMFNFACLMNNAYRDNEKPHVSEVTMGDAEEYYKDLGLEYNIDYKDSSKEKATGRRVTEDYDEEEKKTESLKSKDNSTKEEQTATDPASDDNLFDLIDSMYEDENKE